MSHISNSVPFLPWLSNVCSQFKCILKASPDTGHHTQQQTPEGPSTDVVFVLGGRLMIVHHLNVKDPLGAADNCSDRGSELPLADSEPCTKKSLFSRIVSFSPDSAAMIEEL
mmetsp:Transcript_3232/g.5189  ORF Transcript_3232/g.5189 Transcript_3232/m.5189 type:complete len:112 (+) Transcript_3232:1087-1422(+)